MGAILTSGDEPLYRIDPLMDSWKSLAGQLAYSRDIIDLRTVRNREALRKFLSVRWFSRVWVIQELSRAKKAILITGGYERKLDEQFLDVIREGCRKYGLPIPAPFKLIPGASLSHDLLPMLHVTRSCSATDPRDKVFALMGLAEESVRNIIEIDYSKPVSQCYTRVGVELILRDQNFGILSYSFSEPGLRHRNMILPSWVPDWEDQIAKEIMPAQFLEDEIGAWRFKIKIEKTENLEQIAFLGPDTAKVFTPLPAYFPCFILVRAVRIGYISDNARRGYDWRSATALAEQILHHLDYPEECLKDHWAVNLQWILHRFSFFYHLSESELLNRKDLRAFCEDLKW